MNKAVCLVLIADDSLVCVTRKNDASKIGLPGGKVNEGETTVDAMIREAKEELGISIEPELLKELFTDVCPGEVEFETTTFLYNKANNWSFTDFIAEENSQIVASTVDKLTNTATSPFAEYNELLFKHLALLSAIHS